MASTVRTITKALAGEEDILYGEGLAQQTRGDTTVSINKVRGFKPVNTCEELEELDPVRFPKAIMVGRGLLQHLQWDGMNYSPLVGLPVLLDLTSAAATIDVLTQEVIRLTAPSAHVVVDLVNGFTGMKITIIAMNGNTTIANNTSLVLKSGADYLIPAGTGITFIDVGTHWAEV